MKRMFPMILLFALLLCVPVRADELTLDAPSALLMEKQTGTVLFAKDEHTPREPASVTKVMTLLLTMEAIDSGALSYDDTVTGSAHAASMGGSPARCRTRAVLPDPRRPNTPIRNTDSDVGAAALA